VPSRYLEGTPDKNVSTFWRCRHNVFRADGAGGQFIVVMPDQDVVVAITSDSDNMQTELDAVFDNLTAGIPVQAVTSRCHRSGKAEGGGRESGGSSKEKREVRPASSISLT
jgi:hypothetical protein